MVEPGLAVLGWVAWLSLFSVYQVEFCRTCFARKIPVYILRKVNCEKKPCAARGLRLGALGVICEKRSTLSAKKEASTFRLKLL